MAKSIMHEIPQWAKDKIANAKFTMQRELDLNGQTRQQEKLYTFPPAIFELTQLRKLDLSNNAISILPKDIASLQNLWWLDLSNNQISVLPDTFTKLTNLERLNLNSNRLQSIPEDIQKLYRLEVLNMSGNQLEALPATIADMHRLTNFFLNDNPVHTPSPEILGLSKPFGKVDIPKVRNYFRKIQAEGFDITFEAKLIVLGDGRAGKTSLTRKILNSNADLPLDSTDGVDIHDWKFPLPRHLVEAQGDRKTQHKDFHVHIWDFGGQEVYHATHQFFLTKRSLYILVADGSTQNTDFDYWLHVAQTLSDNSPLIIVVNEKLDRYWDFNESRLRQEFRNLAGTRRVNLATNRGLEKLIQEIKYRITNLSHIGGEIPMSWFKVRQYLEGLGTGKELSYISQTDYFKICADYNVWSLKDKQDLSQYLHDIGVCLHFQDDDILKEIVILDPEWGTNAVYCVLDNPKIKENLGRFNQNELIDIWPEAEYENMHSKLLALMMKFQLCYEIPSWPSKSGRYVAPQLLSKETPSYKWDDAANLLLRYKTRRFMPRGILARFIVVMHEKIEGQRLVWRDGVVLEFNEARVEVIEYYEEKEIRIRVCGRGQRDALTVVDHELKKIYDSFHNLSYERLVPCNCPECRTARYAKLPSQSLHFYRFEVLKRYQSRGVHDIRCEESTELIDVQKLIDDTGIVMLIDALEYDVTDVVQLRQTIIKVFDNSELKILCHDHLQPFDYGALSLPTKEERVFELVEWAERHRRLDDLVEICRKKRSNENWPQKKTRRGDDYN